MQTVGYKEEEKKVGIIELSTRAVKWLTGDQQEIVNNSFDYSYFKRCGYRVEMGQLLDANNNINVSKFIKDVLPQILLSKQELKNNGVNYVRCIATAAYRDAVNKEEIVSLIKQEVGINVKILSKADEADMTLFAYNFSTKNANEFRKAENVILIDQGGGSTEVSYFYNQELVKSVSFEFGTTKMTEYLFSCKSNMKDAFDACDKYFVEKIDDLLLSEFGEYKAVKNYYCVIVGTAATAALGHDIPNRFVHDRELSKNDIDFCISTKQQYFLQSYEDLDSLKKVIYFGRSEEDGYVSKDLCCRLGLPIIVAIMNYFGVTKTHISGTGLWYGAYYKMLYGL